MAQYRKKPVVIDAIRFNGTNENEVADFVGENLHITPDGFLFIHTLEGSMAVSYGDYVIKGVRGEFYPCKPDIFEQTYESVESQKELDDAAKEYAEPYHDKMAVVKAFKTGVEWQKEQYHFFNKAWAENMQAELDRNYENGKQAMKEQMMSEAVEGLICATITGTNAISFLSPLPKELTVGDKVRIIVCKKED